MGDAAVNAGIVGAPMVITIAVTAVAGFLVPAQNDSGSMLRIIMMIMSAFIGFYGVVFGFLGMLIHLATLESFGVPYFDSFDNAGDAQDSLIRMPLWSMVKRPKDIAFGDTTRGRRFIPPLRPHAPDGEGEEP
jgi:Bacillus/Clostridium GerA spore germination protein.